jgi:AcrR family transcriptional regulator
MDARIERTTGSLRAAILRLASEQHVDSLTVSQVAAAANIHRATFYDHAKNPAQLLARVIREELADLRSTYLTPAYVHQHSVQEAIRENTIAVASVVWSHEAIFRHLIDAPNLTTSQHLLAPHFEETVIALLADKSWVLPEGVSDPRLSREDFINGCARYLAAGSAAVVEVWLETAPITVPRGNDPERYYLLIEPLLPRWLTA